MKLSDHIKVTIKTSHTGDAVKAMDEGDVYLIPAPVAEAVVALVEAAGVIHKGWHSFDGFGGPYGECDGIADLLNAYVDYNEVTK